MVQYYTIAMPESKSDLVSRRVWIATALLAAALLAGLALFFTLGRDVPPVLPTVPTTAGTA